jgi:hypothetical protein
MGDESRILRARLAELAARIDRLPESASASDVLVGQVYNGGAGIPTTLPNQFAVRPVTVGGPECEACTPTFAADTTRSAIVTVFGGKVPVAGDNLIVRLVGDRWVARRIKAATTAGNCSVCVQVTTCLSDLSGFTVRVNKSTIFDQTQTTPATGKVCFPITSTGLTASGTYTWTASKAGWTTQTGTVTVPLNGCTGGAVYNATAPMGDPPGYNCCNASAGDVCAGIPLPNTLYLSDGFGTVTLTKLGGIQCIYQGCAMRTANETVADANCLTPLGSASVPVLFQLTINGTDGLLQLFIAGCNYAYLSGGSTYHRILAYRGLTCASAISADGGITLTAVPAGCSPFSWSQSVPVDDWTVDQAGSNAQPNAPVLAIYGKTLTCSVSS